MLHLTRTLCILAALACVAVRAKADVFVLKNEGQRVSFEEEPSAKGPRAGNVRSEG